MTAVVTGALRLCLSAILDAVRLAPRLDQEPADRALGVVLGAALGVLLLGALGWLVLAVTLCLAEVLRSPHGTTSTGQPATPTLLRPRTVRLVVAAVVGAGGLASPGATADPVRTAAVVAMAPAEGHSQSVGRASAPRQDAEVAVELLVGLPVPDRRTGGLDRSGPTTDRPAAVAAIPSARGAKSVRVRRGDSLWGVTVRVLAPGAVDEPDAAVVDRGWRLLYAANRAAVGPDPDLIQPGTQLEVPPRPPFTDPEPGAPR